MLGSVFLGSLSPFGSGKGEELVTRQATVRHKLITRESSLRQAKPGRESSAHYHFDHLFFSSAPALHLCREFAPFGQHDAKKVDFGCVMPS